MLIPNLMKFIVALNLAFFAVQALAQIAAHQPTRYPYTFTNFVWWSDAELRRELARRIPGLPSEIRCDSLEESRIRAALEALLKQKGIQAKVQSIEPALRVNYMGRDPDAPRTAITFSILAPPEITIENLVIENGPPEAAGLVAAEAQRLEGQPYSTAGFWLIRKQVKEALHQAGYLIADADVKAGEPRHDGEHYEVKVIASVDSGPKFHVAYVDGDGGPLLDGRDLSPYFSVKPGDVAKPNGFGMLPASLHAIYLRAGYMDVAINIGPTLDATHALASYHLRVNPGPVYHLRSIKMEGLTAAQEDEAKRFPPLKPGAIYDEMAIMKLSADSSQAGSSLKGYGCSFSPRKDQEAQAVDLELKFYKQ